MIDRVISKLVSVGADLSSKNAIKAALKILGEDEGLADYIYILVKNRAYRKDWAELPVEKRLIFLPQCLRNSKSCQAELTEKGYICKKCGGCDIAEIVETAEELGYKHVYIVPGGSMIYRILKSLDMGSFACLGVACLPELCEASERLTLKDIPHQCVPLRKTGCVDTEVDVEEVKAFLKAGIEHEEEKAGNSAGKN
ncbi:DUF116 domain-containing protein [Archaeoglobus sp.]|jgi:hypothetical protein|uniref:DUF116 domain-containing protein n=1 Tax=Archaeoglobus sp. TaxID=1872626 RepID=UPI0024AA3606|nr:DUF116 domain-containing protein [Archaeoglobus sp.]MDI3498053.1 uncharacterized protein [Archaeoglobus sp.]